MVASIPQGVLQAFRNDPLEHILFDVGKGEAIVFWRRRRAIALDGGRGLAAREEEIAGPVHPEGPASVGVRARAGYAPS